VTTSRRSAREKAQRGLREIAPGIWQLRSQVTCTRTGRRRDIVRQVAGSREEAVAAKRALDVELRQGRDERPTRISVRDYVERWQDRKRREGLAESTLHARADILVDHVLPFLGGYDLRALQPADLLDWRCWALSQVGPRGHPASSATVNGWWRVLKALIRSAFAEFQWGLPPTDAVRPLREDRDGDDADDRTLVEAEVLELLDVLRTQVPPALFTLVVLGFATGCRHCELSALRWPDVDWERGLLHVRRSHVRGRVSERTKTEGSRRKIFLPPPVLALLRRHRDEQQRGQDQEAAEGWVFPSAAGTPLHPATVSTLLQRAAVLAGVGRKVSTKTFRRTWNTLAIRQGLDRALIQANTGHVTDEMTDHYARFRDADRVDAQQRVVGFLGQVVG